MNNRVLEIRNLSKNYKNIKAVSELSLQVNEKMIYGILGPNGSGKTTTLGMLLGVVNQNQGSYSWFENGNKDENRKRIGSLLETPNFYPYLTAEQNLEITAKIITPKAAPVKVPIPPTKLTPPSTTAATT